MKQKLISLNGLFQSSLFSFGSGLFGVVVNPPTTDWILSTTLPQTSTRGVWVDVENWVDTNIWYD